MSDLSPYFSRIGLCLLAFSLLSCSSDSSASNVDLNADGRVRLTVCSSATTATHTVLMAALDKGIFAKHGLDVTVIPVDSGSGAVAALISGGAQLCQISGPAVVSAVVAGADLAIIGGLVNTQVYSLIVPDAILSSSDLRGKAVAISAPGSASDMAMRLALRTLGLQPDRDVAVLAIGGQGERVAALEAGYVVGTLLSPPETILLGQRGFHVLLDMSAMDLPNLQTGTVASKAFIESNRATVLNFMKAIAEAVFFIKSDKDTAVALLSKLLQLDIQKESAALGETYDIFLKGKLVDIPYPSLAAIDAMLDEVELQNPIAAQFKPEDVVDLSIVRELEDNGFFRDLWRRNNESR